MPTLDEVIKVFERQTGGTKMAEQGALSFRSHLDLTVTEGIMSCDPTALARLSDRELTAIGNRIAYVVLTNQSIQDVLKAEIAALLKQLQSA